MSGSRPKNARRWVLAVGVVCVVAGATALAANAAAGVPSSSSVHSSDEAPHVSAGANPSQAVFSDGPGAETLAGTGASGFSGEAGPATASELSGPGGIAVDSAGDIFIADTGNCRVREVPARSGTQFMIAMQAGRIYTVAGGPCASAAGRALGFVSSVAVGPAGEVFVAGGTTNRIFELESTGSPGTLRVVAGSGASGYSGDGGPATAAELDDPQGVGTDRQGDLYIADSENCVVREVASHNGTQWGIGMTAGYVYTIAGTGSCGEGGIGGAPTRVQLWDPSDVVYGPSGDLLIADAGGAYVLCLPQATGSYYGSHISADTIAVIAGTGMYAPYLIDGLPADGQTAELNSPSQIAVDGSGDLFVADTYSSAVREVPAHNGTERGVAVSTGNMYTVAGAIPTGNGNQETKWTDPEVLYPAGLAVAPNGTVMYSDLGANVVREISGS
jgi:NHL repeat